MSHSTGTPAGRRPVAAGLALGVLLALGADGIAVAGLPSLRASWVKPILATPTPQSSATPTTGPLLPSTTSASPKPSTTRSGNASAAPSAGTPGSEVKVTDALERGIVLIEASDSQFVSRGTGMILTPDGQILTNYHVVRSSTSITVTIASTGKEYKAHVVGRNADKDVALLDIAATGLATIKADIDDLNVGDPVVAAGNAAGQGFVTAFSGQVLALGQNIRVKGSGANDPEESLSGLIETNAHAVPGDSGGPLFDTQNEVAGMTTAGSGAVNASDSTVFAVPIAAALEVVAKVRNGEEGSGVVIGPKAALGITVNQAATGVTVATVVAGGAAASAGVKKGDKITAINGVTVSSTDALAAVLDVLEPGTSVVLKWTSGGVAKQASTVLGSSTVN